MWNDGKNARNLKILRYFIYASFIIVGRTLILAIWIECDDWWTCKHGLRPRGWFIHYLFLLPFLHVCNRHWTGQIIKLTPMSVETTEFALRFQARYITLCTKRGWKRIVLAIEITFLLNWEFSYNLEIWIFIPYSLLNSSVIEGFESWSSFLLHVQGTKTHRRRYEIRPLAKQWHVFA